MGAEALILSTVLFASVDQRPEQSHTNQDSWRAPANCGPNCLYAYLKLNGKDILLDDLRRLVPLGPEGTSFWQLQKAAEHFGVPSRIIHSAPAKLRKLTLPAIAHYSGPREGHFTLLLAVRDQSVVTADMTTCEIQEIPVHEFKRLWSGYLLVRQRRTTGVGIVLGTAGGVIVAMGVLIFIRYRRSTSTRLYSSAVDRSAELAGPERRHCDYSTKASGTPVRT